MTNTMKYSRRAVYIGIDVHKRTYTISCVCEDVTVKRGVTMQACPQTLLDFIRKHFAEAQVHSVYEAGFSGFELHRFLEGHGVKSIVVSPASIEVAARDRVKTDRRDSLKMAVQLAAGRLRGIRIPSREEELRRAVTRTRQQIVSERTRLGHQFKSKLYQFGLIVCSDRRSFSEAFIDDYLGRQLPEELKLALTALAQAWRLANEQVREFRQHLAQQARRNPSHQAVYMSVPGVGPVASRTLDNELGDMSHFRNERELFSFLGLTPSEYSSGDSRRLGHISRQGAARLRHILTEVAWRAIKKDPGLQEDYRRISQRAGGKRAIVAIARKIAGRIRACFRTNCRYELGYELAA